jgi:hypothetical protein
MMILKTSRSNLSSNDQLSLDLPFAATKSLAARVGPTPVFTRGSGATYIGSDGLIHGIDTSTTSNTIGTGSRTFTLAATAGQDQFWRAGDAVEASNGANFMVGTVTSYDAATQSLVCNMTSTGGSGTFTSWRIGYRGPRFDHTSAGVCRGLLIEEGRTNLLVQSENFGTTWTAVQLNTTGTPAYLNVATAPDGATTAEKLIANTTSSTHQFRQDVTLVSGTSYTISVYFKAAETNFATISVVGAANGNVDWVSYFDISASSPAAGQFNGFANTSLVDVGNGWRRCSVTFTATASGNLNTRFGGASASTLNSNFYTGDGTSGFLIWGAQLEVGSFATSYIPTTTGSVVRSADVCSITGANFTGFYNQSEGTAVMKFTNADTSGFPQLFTFNQTAAPFANRIYVVGYNRMANTEVGIITSSVTQLSYIGSLTSKAGNLSLSYKTNDAAYAKDGVIAATDNTVSLGTSIDRLQIQETNGCIASFRYYKKRLPNAKLTQLTA